jgi:hypothetical protein
MDSSPDQEGSMIRILVGIFLILHGLVHVLYAGHSWGVFELQPEMVWPEGSWAFSKLIGAEPTRWLATFLLGLIAIGSVVGGIGLLANRVWWRPAVTYVAAFSSLVYILLWNGKFQALDNQGGIGILINIALVVAASILQWPV